MGSWQISTGIAALAAILLVTALTLPSSGPARWKHLVFGLIVAALGVATGWLWNMDYRIARSERVAERLADGHYPPEARIQMALEFFEKYKDLYPESYARMQEYYRTKGCVYTEKDFDNKQTIECMRNQVETSIYFRGMLRAVAPPIPEDGLAH
jgi:hypothetical protein